MHEIFLDELKKLNTQFMEMGVFVNDQIDQATRAFVDHDKKTAQSMVDNEEKIPTESILLPAVTGHKNAAVVKPFSFATS